MLPTTRPPFTAPTASTAQLTAGAGDYLLIADWGGDKGPRYDGAAGTFVDTFVPKHRGGMNSPFGVLYGPHDGTLYVSTGSFGA